jgi:hypothetical protein
VDLQSNGGRAVRLIAGTEDFGVLDLEQPHNKPLQTDERRVAFDALGELTLAPLAAERQAVSRMPRIQHSPIRKIPLTMLRCLIESSTECATSYVMDVTS